MHQANQAEIIRTNLAVFEQQLADHCRQIGRQRNEITLVAVSKLQPIEAIMAAYEAGQRDFGENYVQELTDKHSQLPTDIRWHLIGHLQTNKVKYIAGFVHLIHSLDSLRLLAEIDKQAKKCGRIIDCLIQIHISTDSTKTGATPEEGLAILQAAQQTPNVNIKGLMGVASLTESEAKVATEFAHLAALQQQWQAAINPEPALSILSIGMSGDYPIALKHGATLIRVGTGIFGARK